jgi:hypothetical protein
MFLGRLHKYLWLDFLTITYEEKGDISEYFWSQNDEKNGTRSCVSTLIPLEIIVIKGE